MNHLAYTDYSIYQDIEPQAKSSLGYHTNNKYPTFPPLMSDGRAITASWQPEAVANNHLIEQNNIQSNWEYRKFLTDNAVQLMKENFTETSNDMGYYKRYAEPTVSGNAVSGRVATPFVYTSSNYGETPKGYVMSDLKSDYLSREELEQRKQPVVFTQEKMLQYPR